MICFGVYKIVNVADGNNTTYVGSTTRSFRERMYEHSKSLNGGHYSNSRLQRSWNKYGGDSFEFSVIEIIGERTLCIPKEQYWLDVIKEHTPVFNCGNHVFLTRLGIRHTEESRRKMSLSQTGKKLSKEHIEKVRVHSIEMGKLYDKEYPELVNIFTGHIHPPGKGFTKFCRMHDIPQRNATFVGKMVSGKEPCCYGWMPANRYVELDDPTIDKLRWNKNANYNRKPGSPNTYRSPLAFV